MLSEAKHLAKAFARPEDREDFAAFTIRARQSDRH